MFCGHRHLGSKEIFILGIFFLSSIVVVASLSLWLVSVSDKSNNNLIAGVSLLILSFIMSKFDFMGAFWSRAPLFFYLIAGIYEVAYFFERLLS